MRIAFLGNHSVTFSTETHHAKTLESMGHEVVRLQETQAGGELIQEEAQKSDLFVWTHTHGWQTPGKPMKQVLQELTTPSVTYHLDLWLGLERQKDLDTDDVYKYIDHFFTVDKKMAEWFNRNTKVKGHYLPAGVFDQECYMLPQNRTQTDVIFVGSKNYHPEWPYRPQLIDWLKRIYPGFKHYGGDGLGVVREKKLNQLYANTKVAVGDSLCINFDYPHYWSDRVYETLGRGGFLIHPYIRGMEKHFNDGEHLVFYNYGDFNQLKELIDYYLENDTERESIRQAGHEHVKTHHTYRQRWNKILDTVCKKH